ncbi:MAG: cytochrome c [Bacteroidota bacterium]
MKQNIFIVMGAAVVTCLSSCWWKSGGNDTGIEYAPDMYYSKGYEPFTQFSDSNKYRYNPYFMSMREPATGSVAEGQLDYKYAFDNTPEGYEAAGAALQMPTDLSFAEQAEGQRLYGIYCAVCHGENGGNDGSVSSKQSTLKPSWANYQDKYVKDLPVGKIYHVITYGKNNMGSYASALTPRDRWAVISYVKRLSMMDSLNNIPAAVAPVEKPAATEAVAATPVVAPEVVKEGKKEKENHTHSK